MPDNPDNLEIVVNFGQTLDRAQLAEVEPRRSERDRLVWYAGIAGYVLFNANEAWRVLLGRSLSADDLLALSAPWTLAALFALVAHLTTAEWLDRDNLLYHAWRTEVDRLRSLGKERPITRQEVLDLINGTTPHIACLKTRLKHADRWAKRLRRAAFVTLCLAFVWGLVGPRVIRSMEKPAPSGLTRVAPDGGQRNREPPLVNAGR